MPEENISGLARMIKNTQRAEQLTDRELVDQLYLEIWSKFPLSSYEEALFDELLARFQKKCGIGGEEKNVRIFFPDEL